MQKLFLQELVGKEAPRFLKPVGSSERSAQDFKNRKAIRLHSTNPVVESVQGAL